MKKLLTISAALVALSLTGCESRECLSGHHTWTVMPVSGMGVNGQPTISYVPQQIWVCDEYAPEPVTANGN